MEKKKIIQSVIFLIIGICLFWLVFRNTNLDQILTQLTRFNLLWIGASVGINIISQLIRAYRWKLLFKPLNYKPKIFNLFLAIIILAFTNQIIPRGGEFSRLGVINRVEKIPFSKLLGIALAERTTDFIVLILIAIGILIWQFSSIQKLLHL
ncbi:MAG TPA: lysylphosphatidylglycerol synthase transmembrane domain-containing protein, partial [Bacteroidales bacterium]|nr:lysylphosphatidylglycerol synthase transmembrane domain-containing protein [Bacteroidales bacterium]